MHVALKTSGYQMLTAVSFLGMGDIVTKEAFDWIFSNPKIITASSVIGRLMDDIKSHKVCNLRKKKSYKRLKLVFEIYGSILPNFYLGNKLCTSAMHTQYILV